MGAIVGFLQRRTKRGLAEAHQAETLACRLRCQRTADGKHRLATPVTDGDLARAQRVVSLLMDGLRIS
jgi:hypothetical protein